MFVVQAETEIDASAAVVWAVLTEMEAYAAWSTMLHYRGGALAEGGTIQLRLSLPNGPSYTFAPRVIALEPERRFTWRASTGRRGIFDGEHSFELTPLAGGRTLLRNRERYSGLLAPLFQRLPSTPAFSSRWCSSTSPPRRSRPTGRRRGSPCTLPPAAGARYISSAGCSPPT